MTIQWLEIFTNSANNVLLYKNDGPGNLTDWAARVTNFQYDNTDRLDRVEFQNGTQRKFSYDMPEWRKMFRDEVIATGAVIN